MNFVHYTIIWEIFSIDQIIIFGIHTYIHGVNKSFDVIDHPNSQIRFW